MKNYDHSDRCIRNSRKDYNDFHDLPYPFWKGTWIPHDLRWRNPQGPSAAISASAVPKLSSQKPASTRTVSFTSSRRSVVILNIEEDHLDFFKDLEDIRHSFHQFAALLPSDGTLVINGEIKDYPEIYSGLDCSVVSYGSSPDFDYSSANITYNEEGHVSFDLVKTRRIKQITSLCP